MSVASALAPPLGALRAPEQRVPDAVAPPPGHPRFPLLDALRAIAALGVLVAHAAGVAHVSTSYWWGPLVANGNQGVTVFFVLSGFLLYRPLVSAALNGAPRTPWRVYLRRRLLRIVPAYWLALTVLGLTVHLPGVFGPRWWYYYFFLQVYNHGVSIGGIVVAWSVCIEVSFYLLLPLWAAGLERLSAGRAVAGRLRLELPVLAGLAGGAVLLRLVDAGFPQTLPVYFEWFAAGMALALLSAAYEGRPVPGCMRRLERRPAAWWAGAIGAYVAICAILGPPQPAGYPSWKEALIVRGLGGVAAVMLVVPAVFGHGGGGVPRRVLAWAPLAWIGLISYGIYLWHLSLLERISAHVSIHGNNGASAFAGLTVLTAAAAVAVAAASYYVVERPLLRLKFRNR